MPAENSVQTLDLNQEYVIIKYYVHVRTFSTIGNEFREQIGQGGSVEWLQFKPLLNLKYILFHKIQRLIFALYSS